MFKSILNYKLSWSPRRYCKNAVTKRPEIVTGNNPRTIPDKSGSTIKNFYLKTIAFYSLL